MNEYQVVALTPADDGEVTAFLDRLGLAGEHPVLAYHYPAYRDMLTGVGVGEGASLGLRRGGHLVAVLPAVIRRAAEGSVLCSLPFFGPNAGVICAAEEADRAVPALLGAAADMMRGEARPLGMTVYEPLFGRDGEHYRRALPQAVAVERFTQVTTLDGRPWSKSLRYDIRRAETLGVTVEDGVDATRLTEFYGLYRSNCADTGIPLKPFSVVEALAANPRQARFLFAFHDGRMVAGLLNLWGPRVVSYYMPCTLAAARALQPGALLIDRAAAAARAAGLAWWNWEGSPSRDSGVYRFKQRWNAEEVPFRIHVQALCPPADLAALGRERLSAAFPWFFVYPFERL